MTEPVSLAEIKQHLVLDPDDTSEDGYLTALLVAARRGCEKRINRAIVDGARTLVLDAFPGGAGWYLVLGGLDPVCLDIALPGGPVSTVDVRYDDVTGVEQLLDPETYFLAATTSPARLRPTTGWPDTQARPGAVRIAYTVAGLVDDDLTMVAHAIRLTVGHWYANREAVVSDNRVSAAEMPIAVSWLLEPLRTIAAW